MFSVEIPKQRQSSSDIRLRFYKQMRQAEGKQVHKKRKRQHFHQKIKPEHTEDHQLMKCSSVRICEGGSFSWKGVIGCQSWQQKEAWWEDVSKGWFMLSVCCNKHGHRCRHSSPFIPLVLWWRPRTSKLHLSRTASMQGETFYNTNFLHKGFIMMFMLNFSLYAKST